MGKLNQLVRYLITFTSGSDFQIFNRKLKIACQTPFQQNINLYFIVVNPSMICNNF